MYNRIVVCAPHPDDAAFSLGGLLTRPRSIPIEVITVFSRSRYTIAGDGDVDAVTALREREEKSALSEVGVPVTFLGFEDAGLRSEFTQEEDYLDPNLVPESDSRYGSVRDALTPLLADPSAFILGPLGVGDHVDHRIVCDVLRRQVEALDRVGFFLDWGYDAALNRAAWQTKLKEFGLHDDCMCAPLFDAARKLELASSYRSQVNETMISLLRRSAACLGGEMLFGTKAALEGLNDLVDRFFHHGNVSLWQSEY